MLEQLPSQRSPADIADTPKMNRQQISPVLKRCNTHMVMGELQVREELQGQY